MCDNTPGRPAGRLPLSCFLEPNYTWPVIHLVISDQSITHFITATQNTTERVEEKIKRTNTGLGQLQGQERGSLRDTFV